mmetsp:Transcript_8165/g.30116  ORF Transcript_8165/g.30116 Transcript_8165/m.30116 type:complete len:278 (-) Transcript_8165:372-1205(-)
MHTATLWRAHRRDRLAGPGLAVFHGRVVVTDLEEVGEHKAREGVGHQDGKAPTGAVQRERQTQVDADPGGEGKLAHGPAVGAILEKVVQREEKRDHTERERGVKPLQRVKGMPRLLVMVSQEGVHGRHIVVQHHVVRVDVVRAVVLLPPERRPDSPHVLQNLVEGEGEAVEPGRAVQPRTLVPARMVNAHEVRHQPEGRADNRGCRWCQYQPRERCGRQHGGQHAPCLEDAALQWVSLLHAPHGLVDAVVQSTPLGHRQAQRSRLPLHLAEVRAQVA